MKKGEKNGRKGMRSDWFAGKRRGKDKDGSEEGIMEKKGSGNAG